MADGAAKPQLYLVCSADAGAAARLASALQAVPVAAVLIVPGADGALAAGAVKSLVELVQKSGVAALIADDAGLARMLKADGVHLSWHKDQEKRFAEAREALGLRFMLGADAGRSRHEAMVIGEAAGDYVAFGIPPHVEDRATAKDRQTDLITWWSELFEVPSVAFDAEDAGDVARLAAAGADFVAVRLPMDLSAVEAAAWTARMTEALEASEAVG